VRGSVGSQPLPQPQLRYLIAIASSTGGPSAVLELVKRIRERFPAGIVIAQHMPDKFTKTFAERLDRNGTIRVSEAMDNDGVLANRAFVCPGKACMEVFIGAGGGIGLQADLRIRLSAPNKNDRYVPSGDRLFKSVADVAGARAVGIILTGMGDDGTKGARAILDAGGMVIAESEESAVVYGMPGSAVRAGAVTEVLPLSGIGDYLSSLSQP
jgi:two-component system chemotaxis response regulator CheB